MADYIERSNVKWVSDGTVVGTHLYFIDPDGVEHELTPVVAIQARLDASDQEPVLSMVVALGQVDITIPAKLVEFIRVETVEVETVDPDDDA